MTEKFTQIDLDSWERKENYNWFTTKNNCTIVMTANIEITNLLKFVKEKKLRCYPVFSYMISNVVNHIKEFKIGFDADENLGYWDIIYPRYPIFHEEDKRISILWSEYDDNFGKFYKNVINDINRYGEIRSMAAKGRYPLNCFDVTSMPWVSFTSFSCQSISNALSFSPFVAIGKFFEDGGKILLPVSMGSHHAVSDGYHVSKFFMDLQNFANNFDAWLKPI